MVMRQLQRMSSVPRVFGWSTQPSTKASVPLFGSRDEVFEGLNVRLRGTWRLLKSYHVRCCHHDCSLDLPRCVHCCYRLIYVCRIKKKAIVGLLLVQSMMSNT